MLWFVLLPGGRLHMVQAKEAAAGHSCLNAYLLLTEAFMSVLAEFSTGLHVRLTSCSCSCSRYNVSASLFGAHTQAVESNAWNTAILRHNTSRLGYMLLQYCLPALPTPSNAAHAAMHVKCLFTYCLSTPANCCIACSTPIATLDTTLVYSVDVHANALSL